MMRFTDDQGRPAAVKPTALVVPPELYWEAATLLGSAYFPDVLTTANQDLGMNPLRGMLSLDHDAVSDPARRLVSCWTRRGWCGRLCCKCGKDFAFDALEGSSENGFLRDQFLYGVRARYNVGFGDWRAAFGSLVG